MIAARSRRKGASDGSTIAFAGSVVLHGAVVAAMLVQPSTSTKTLPVMYKVDLVAAPAPEPEAKRAPEAVTRPVERPAPVVNKPPPKRAPAPVATPPARQPAAKAEPSPRVTSSVKPDSGVKPSTGSDVATIKTAGVDNFPYPGYIDNIVTQVYRHWQRPQGNAALEAEIMFLINRDGSVSKIQFIKRSGNYVFDLEAKGAIEAAAAAQAFGSLPEGWPADVLPVSFFFNPATIR